MGTPPTSTADRGRGLRLVGGVLLVLGIVLVVVGAVRGFSAIADIEVTDVRGSAVIQADAGSELSIYRTRSASEGSCTVVGPDAGTLALAAPFGTETVTVNGREYTVDRVAMVTAGGAQTVTCTGTGFAAGPRVGVFGLVGGILVGVFGGLGLVAIGVVLLVVGFSRRGGRGDQQPPWAPGWPNQSGAAPGWPSQGGAPPGWPPQPGPPGHGPPDHPTP